MNDTQPTTETQLTTAPHGHILTNTAVWSPDSQWIVYDVRSDPAGSVFDGTRIERVNVRTKQIEVLYESKNGACVGVATVNPVDGRVVFIHGPEFPTPDWSYSACHREGVIVDPKKPGVAVPLEARDIVPPFTPGALRGGTHVHTWESGGGAISFTYEDHVLTHGKAEGREPNRRTIGIAVDFDLPIVVPKSHPRNRDGTHACEIIVLTNPYPKPGSNEIGRAFEDGWIPGQMALTFIGEVIATDGRKVNELFVCDWPDDRWNKRGLDLGTEARMPLPSGAIRQTRLTRFADTPDHTGLTMTPRHWPRASPNGKLIVFLTGTGQLHVMKHSTPFNSNKDIKSHPINISSAFTWHPNGRFLCAIVDKSVCLIRPDIDQVVPLTAPSDPPPRPEACVVSPDGTMIAFVRQVNGFNQIFIVDVPTEAVK
jgi:hypothetical protein